MIYLYPANKMENLLTLFVKIQQISPLPVLSQEVIIVHNAGMQHWLDLSLAKQQDISLNNNYALPSQYLWQLVRSAANGNAVPKQAPYSREALVWRIDKLLTSEAVLTDTNFEQVNHYWKNKVDKNNIYSEKEQLKRFQLATELADLYEQYLIFRPQWLDDWQQNKIELDSHVDLPDAIEKMVIWQAKLWQILTQKIAYNPKTLIRDAIANIALHKQLLPPRISFIGINSLAPIWLEFVSALSEHIEVHFFHLNPCYDYWGDLLTEKQAVKSLSTWINPQLPLTEQIHALVGNPLLANFGQQGREFLALLQQYSTINIEAFERQLEPIETNELQLSVLQQLQNDVLSLSDARVNPKILIDDSIVITSAHSALREVQGLHDWLLHQLNQHTSLTPKDILVMCPQVENYAPYIDAVFNRGEQNRGNSVPSLPCSISDRISMESEPLIRAFIELLQLPDSRFQVSKLIDFLRLPAMQTKFNLTIENIDKITRWLDQASIHWGLNAVHKQQILNIKTSNDYFTWNDGLTRLLLGFAYGDEAVIYQNKLLLPTIEDNDATLLGKLLQILEQLQCYANDLASVKSASAWLNCLEGLLNQLFSLDDDLVIDVINNALNALVDHCSEANYDELISLSVVREFLNNHFSQPDHGRQFLVGQITFCSMLPMRSIPFKIIAILGLNDGEFPRQRQPLSFDLMAVTPAKIGDRSRRGDDRYLFLEAMICARNSFYLSYQGRNIRNNNVLQASMVLKELMEYLDLGYGWSLLNNNKNDDINNAKDNKESQSNQDNIKPNASRQYSRVRQLAMQPFSIRNYQQSSAQGKITDPYLSFDRNWLKIGTNNRHKQQQQPLLLINENLFNKNTLNNKPPIEISLDDVIKFFDHPSKYFAKNQLNLHFEQYNVELNDSEPFNNDSLASYQFQQALLLINLEVDNGVKKDEIVTDITLQTTLSGKFPDSPLTQQFFLQWQKNANKLATVIKENKGEMPTLIPLRLLLNVDEINIALTADLPIKNNQCVSYRNTKSKAKDHFTLYLYRLFSLVYQQNQLNTINSTSITSTNEQLISQVTQATGWYFDPNEGQILTHNFTDINDPKTQLTQLLNTFLKGQQHALLVNINIGEKYMNSKEFEQVDFEKYWSDPNSFNALNNDEYIQFFWPTCPSIADHSGLIEQSYQGLYRSMKSTKLKGSS